MRTIGRVVGLSIVVAIFFPKATARTAEARFGQQPCGVASLLPPPPAPRPHYVLRVQVLPGLRTVKGALTVTFTAPTERGTDRLILRLWPNGGPYASAGAHLFVSRVREGNRPLPVSYPDPTTLVIARPVAAGEQVVVSMNWRLLLPRETGLRMKGGGRSVRLGCRGRRQRRATVPGRDHPSRGHQQNRRADELLGPVRYQAILPRRLPPVIPSPSQPRSTVAGGLCHPAIRHPQRLPHRPAARSSRRAPNILSRCRAETRSLRRSLLGSPRAKITVATSAGSLQRAKEGVSTGSTSTYSDNPGPRFHRQVQWAALVGAQTN